ncbi:MAG: L-lysine 6-transaminase [Myxococcota bacterium]
MHHVVSPAEARAVIGKHMIVRDNFDFVMDLEKSHGSYIVDARESVTDSHGNTRTLSMKERTYLDFYTQFAAWPISYNHPRLAQDEDFHKALIRASLHKIANSDIMTVEKATFVQRMGEVAIHDGLDYLFLISGGALAVENALKAAFDWKIRINFQKGILKPESEYSVIHFRHAFHGRTGYTMSMTNTDPDKVRFFPKFEHWPRISSPAMRFPLEQHLAEVEQLEAQALAEIRAALQRNSNTVAAIILETVQAEGGDRHFRPEFFKALRTLTQEHDILLILDEVQAGCGLTGKFWAYQHMGIVPDMISFGKKMQVCGVLARKATFSRVQDNCFTLAGRINSTWGADLSDMVRATRLLEIIRDEQLVDNAATQGQYILKHLRKLEAEHDGLITNTRGLGLMAAFDFHDPAKRTAFVNEMKKHQVLTLTCGTHTIRLRPLLDVQQAHIDEYMAAADASLKSLHHR